MPASILLVESAREAAAAVAGTLAGRCHVVVRDTLAGALDVLQVEPFDCALLAQPLRDALDLDGLRALVARHDALPVVVLAARGSEDVAVAAMKLGAADYVVKRAGFELDLPRLVADAVGRGALRGALEHASGAAQRTELSAALRERLRTAGIVGESDALVQTALLLERVASSGAPVLLEGETGTGKELMARALHLWSDRARRPFVAQNCAAIADGLLESELFGCARGAYTGADRARPGLFEEAHGGTLFLDEIGEAARETQAKLLRTLQEGEIRRVGESATRRVDVRIVAASNRDLEQEARGGRFRLDLYHRLSVVPVRVPALRERRGDVRLLLEHFLDAYARRAGLPVPRVDADAWRILESYAWPGNVRELQNESFRLMLAASDGRITADRVSVSIRGHAARRQTSERSLKEILRDVESATIQARLRQHGYQRAITARSLGITREGLWLKIRQLGLQLPRRGSLQES
ncbi:MAG: sigma-54-dependent Fis family transcriptional regulator [Deltaproteobacteria bacterium]|nr:sigma-54-dependent Fis family transcriptional regulator [Deltaproteobacteria bacterium]